ncbi:MAG: hypothetical protein K6348_09005 [Deferribacterales bacterium]
MFLRIIIILLIANLVLAFTPPNNLLEYYLVRYDKSESAKNEIYHLHGKRFPLKEAFIAEYRNNSNGKIIIWGSVSYNNKEAKELFNMMHTKMPNSNLFTGLKKYKIKQIDIFYVKGMGMDNVYFVKDNINIWIASINVDLFKISEAIINDIK